MWWMDVIVVVVLAFGVYCFLSLVRWRTRWLSTKTTRRAEDMYDLHADRPRRRHRRSLIPSPFHDHESGHTAHIALGGG
jgi:hypothetical protein